MKTDIKEKDIFLIEDEYSMLYEIDTFRYIKSPEDPIENRIQVMVKKTFVKKDSTGYLFSVEVIKRTQSNLTGIFDIENQLDSLQKKLVLYTNEHGDIITIVNRGKIFEKWYDQKASFKKRYKNSLENIDDFIEGVEALINDPIEFLNLVKKSEVLTLLFPPVYGHNLLKQDSIKQKKVVDDFFETTALPFKIDTKVTAFNTETNGYQAMRSGDIDSSVFDKERAIDLIGSLFGVHKYNIEIDANYLEAFDLNKNKTIDEATMLINVEAAGVYSYRQVSKLRSM